jgi:hypothetical protein
VEISLLPPDKGSSKSKKVIKKRGESMSKAFYKTVEEKTFFAKVSLSFISFNLRFFINPFLAVSLHEELKTP